MKKKIYLDEFEAFLSEAAEDHRMYPSDRVWRNIQHEIHGHTKWPALTFGAILAGAIILAGLIFIQPDKELFYFDSSALRSKQPPVIVSTSRQNHEFTDAVAIRAQQIPGKPLPNAGRLDLMVLAETNNEAAYFENSLDNNEQTPDADLALKPITKVPQPQVLNDGFALKDFDLPVDPLQATLSLQAGTNNNLLSEGSGSSNFYAQEASGNELTTTEASDLGASSEASQTGSSIFGAEAGNVKATNWYTGVKKASRWNMQYYLAPSFSNRILLEDKSYDWHVVQNGPVAPNITYGVNRFVRHNAKLGLEAGAAVLYSVNDRFRLKGGLQVNFRQYAIEGFRSTQPEPATLRLMSDNPGGDIITTYASLSSMLGEQPAVVNNQYLQVGIPLGFDLELADWNRVQFFVAATVQPTYQIAERSLLISSDYKHYVSQPDLIRKFNINTGIEAFLSFKGAGLNWQVGPQIRYQMMPGAVSEYPIHEHLIDYGMKIGVVKQLR